MSGDIHSQISALLAEGYPVRSDAAGRTGRVVQVDGSVVYIRGKRGRDATTFQYGPPVSLCPCADGFGWAVVDLPDSPVRPDD